MTYAELEYELLTDTPAFVGSMRWSAAHELATAARAGSPEAVGVLARALETTFDRRVRKIATKALRSLPEGPAVDALCAHWGASRHPALEALLVERCLVARKPPELRVLSALKADRLDLLAEPGVHFVAPLVEAASDADTEIAQRATGMLGRLTSAEAREALCRLAVTSSERALTIASKADYIAQDPATRSAFLVLNGRWEAYDAVDIDGVYLHAAYEAASPNVRRRIAACARRAGRTEWVQVAVGGRERRRLAEMTRAEWQDVIALLARPERAAEAWRLAQEAPPLWARALLLAIGDAAALPKCDHEDFARLRVLAELCGEGEISFWACTRHLATLRGHVDPVLCLAVTPDGSMLASGSEGNTIRLWRLPDGECAATLRGHENQVGTLAVTPDGSLLASGSYDKTIRLWRLPGGECLATLQPKHTVFALAVTPDGSLLASANGYGTIRLWRLPEGKRVAKLRGHEDRVASLAVTPDGSLLASASYDKTIRLWRLPGGECVATLRGHENRVGCLAVTPDGSLLASASEDNTIRLWRLPEGECVATLRGHEDSVLTLAITPDGSLLASASGDKTIVLWGSEFAALTAAPVAALVRDHDRLLTLPQREYMPRSGRVWLDFILALIDRHRRFDIEVEASAHVEVGEFDIEIEV